MLKIQTNENREVLKWPVYPQQIRPMFPHVTFPEGDLSFVDLTHLGLEDVQPTVAPELSSDDVKLALDTPVWTDGQWVRTYKEVPKNTSIDPPAE